MRRFALEFVTMLIPSGVAGIAAAGWYEGWNAYTNLSLSLGALLLAVVWIMAVARRAAS